MRRNVAIRQAGYRLGGSRDRALAAASGPPARRLRAPRPTPALELARRQRQEALDERQEPLGRLLLAAAPVHDGQVRLLGRNPAALVAVGEEADRRHAEGGGEVEQVGVAGQEE